MYNPGGKGAKRVTCLAPQVSSALILRFLDPPKPQFRMVNRARSSVCFRQERASLVTWGGVSMESECGMVVLSRFFILFVVPKRLGPSTLVGGGSAWTEPRGL